MVSPSVTWLDANVDNSSVNKIKSPDPHPGFSYGLVGDFFFNTNYGIGTGIRVTGFDEAFDYGAAHHTSADNCDFLGHDCSLLPFRKDWFCSLNLVAKKPLAIWLPQFP